MRYMYLMLKLVRVVKTFCFLGRLPLLPEILAPRVIIPLKWPPSLFPVALSEARDLEDKFRFSRTRVKLNIKTGLLMILKLDYGTPRRLEKSTFLISQQKMRLI